MPVQLLNAMLGTLVLITLSGVSAPVTLRSRNAVDYVVDSRSAASHSTRLRTLIANLDEPGDTIPLPNVCDAELQTIVEFINNIPKRQDVLAAQWARSKLATTRLDAQCRLLTAAYELDMRPLTRAIMSTKRKWSEISAMRKMLVTKAFRFDVRNAPPVALLEQAAQTCEQKAIVRMIRRLIVLGGSANFINSAAWDRERKMNLLQWASYNGKVLVAEFLADAPGADVNAPDGFGMTSLHLAVLGGHADVVELLVNTPGVDVNAPILSQLGETPLHMAAYGGHASAVYKLLKAPTIDVNARDDCQMTPLLWATYKGHTDVVQALLLAPTIDVNAFDGEQQAPLHLAARYGYEQIVKLLLADPNVDSNAREGVYQKTPIEIAAQWGHLHLCLLMAGADDQAPVP
ncbi:Ankyrin repeat domain-containing protein [Plasmodiophora brassicae]|uniref:Uncharacterized protein n=1 Tax=Plasmodiophora brassicae TaxID=37360 RepID=A0A0G4IU54_PLABS|nr:hypothetical protein PBRA_006919 [Plasmodiophora brassicae]